MTFKSWCKLQNSPEMHVSYIHHWTLLVEKFNNLWMFKKSTLPKIAHSWRNGLIWKHLDVVCYWEHLLLWKAKYFYTDSEKKSKLRFLLWHISEAPGRHKHYIQWSELHKRMHSQTNININWVVKVGNVPAYLLAISLTATFLHLGGMQMTASFLSLCSTEENFI